MVNNSGWPTPVKPGYLLGSLSASLTAMSLTLCILMVSSFWFDTINLESCEIRMVNFDKVWRLNYLLKAHVANI